MRYDAGEVITAMVTPFNAKREVDYEKVEALAHQLVNTGSDAVLVTGTTGEAPTLTYDEEIEILCSAKRAVNKQGKVIMGTGSNSTETAVKTAKLAEKEGADAILSVVPYYNKPSQSGMIEHFSAVAEAVDLPVILYNIPGRTGVNMSVETVKTLARKYENIVGIKQSFGDMDAVTELRASCPNDFAIYSGDDSLTLPMVSVGAHGVISVASHVIGKEMKEMLKEFKSGNIKKATEKHLALYPLFKKIFMAPNPIPVKECLKRMGIIENYVRRPLVELDEEERKALYSVLEQYI